MAYFIISGGWWFFRSQNVFSLYCILCLVCCTIAFTPILIITAQVSRQSSSNKCSQRKGHVRSNSLGRTASSPLVVDPLSPTPRQAGLFGTLGRSKPKSTVLLDNSMNSLSIAQPQQRIVDDPDELENIPPDPTPDFARIKAEDKKNKSRRSSAGTPLSRLLGAATRVSDSLRRNGVSRYILGSPINFSCHLCNFRDI